jgi:hypothetical protein
MDQKAYWSMLHGSFTTTNYGPRITDHGPSYGLRTMDQSLLGNGTGHLRFLVVLIDLGDHHFRGEHQPSDTRGIGQG